MEADSHLLSICLWFKKTSGAQGGHQGQEPPITAALCRVCTGVPQHHWAPFVAAVVSDCTRHPLPREDKSRDGYGSVSLFWVTCSYLGVSTVGKHGINHPHQSSWGVTALWHSWAAPLQRQPLRKKEERRNMDKLALLCVASCEFV